ncbi:MAG TPA: hypothetical protein VMZ26_06475, partial [Pyrinomonadaceae bacterium]|nr:hypothetical protein [Pyrinomonadaceae bacterium]
MYRIVSAIALSVILAAAGFAQSGFTIDNLIATKRVGDPQLSPDGRTVAFTVGTVDKAANRTLTHIYTIRIDGTNLKQITSGDKSNSSPRWSPDGKRLAYATGGDIWTMEPDGDGRKQITRISSGAGNPVWSPDGKWIAFSSEVYPECTSDDCNKAEDARAESSKVQAKVTERLLFKHWNEWRNRKRAHVFVVSSSGGIAADFTPGDFDAPPYGASTGVDYAFSPDSREIAFLKNPDKIEAISTNSDIIVASLVDKNQKNITVSNRGYDAAPLYTPDGKYLLYRSQATEGFEADRWRIMRYNRATGETVELTRGFDQQVDEMTVTNDSKTIYFAAGTRGRAPIYSLPVEPDFKLRIATHVKTVLQGYYANSVSVSGDGRTIVFAASSIASPPELMRVNSDGSGVAPLTTFNEAVYRGYRLQKAEDMEWKGAVNANIHGFVIKPANFDPSRKYPLVVLIHGGPQSAFNDSWGYRWNPQVFANAGYVVF